MNNKYLSIMLTTLMMLTSVLSCDVIHPELNHSSADLVVEGWIDDGGFPIVMVTSTVPLQEKYTSFDSLSNYIVKWAKVTISDGEKKVVLTGKVNKKYEPPYIYTTSYMRGRSGKTYTLNVDVENRHVEAVTTIPEPVKIDSIKITPTTASDTTFNISAYFTDNQTQKNYYKFFINDNPLHSYYKSCYMGTLSDVTISEHTKVQIYKGVSLLNKVNMTDFDQSQIVLLKFAQMDEVSYNFWSDYDDMILLSRVPLFPSSKNIRSNIKGGLGYWCGYGASEYVVNLKDSVKSKFY